MSPPSHRSLVKGTTKIHGPTSFSLSAGLSGFFFKVTHCRSKNEKKGCPAEGIKMFRQVKKQV